MLINITPLKLNGSSLATYIKYTYLLWYTFAVSTLSVLSLWPTHTTPNSLLVWWTGTTEVKSLGKCDARQLNKYNMEDSLENLWSLVM